ncbi:MAG: peptidoglycan DD-metalloendopeptidase family protein [Gammaproteobacteria bacterium]|nr:peptidoglycan DD-metalloendopeptidase family protein [Gammaproteobacteria bacterium]
MLRPGDVIELRHEEGRILELRRPISETLELLFTRNGKGFSAEFVSLPIEVRTRHARAQISSSLFMAALDAGLSEQLTMNLAGIFAWDVDFVLDIRSGDSFTVIYQQLWQDGEFLRDGEILAAEFVNDKNIYRAIRYEDPNGEVGYFTPDALNMRKAFLRAPVDFSRVSSRFNPRRLHPVYKKVRAHKGVDYAAPTGTPIRAAGDGKIIFRGRKGGYGNAVILQHGGNITTLYAHMSRFAKPRTGARVKQGQIIGYVGKTGTATASHLHYEYRINGIHRNPRTVELPQAEPVPRSFRDDFVTRASPLLAQLDLVNQTRLAAAAD